MKRDFLVLLLILLLASCATRKEIDYVNVNHYDTVYYTKLKYDSIYIKEDTKTLNDTVYVTSYQFKYKLCHDTVYQSVTNDSIRTVTKVETVKESNSFLVGCTWAFWLLLLAIIIYVAIRIILKIRKL